IWPRSSPERGQEHAYDDSYYCADPGVGRRAATLGLQSRLGLRTRRWTRAYSGHRHHIGADWSPLIHERESEYHKIRVCTAAGADPKHLCGTSLTSAARRQRFSPMRSSHSSSVSTATPSSLALPSFEPAAGPATT